MSRRAWLDLAFALLVLVPVGLMLGKLAFPRSQPFAALTELHLTAFACLAKLVFLFMGAVVAFSVASRFEPATPSRQAWRLLAMGLLSFFLGQLTLSPYQMVLLVPSPFPSPAEVFFLLSYPLLIASLFVFIRAYGEAGYPLGSVAGRRTLAAATALVCGAVGYWALGPVASAPAPRLEKFLNLAYPVLDLVILVPAVLLLRLTLPLRGGRLGRVWIALLGGFVFLGVGDVLYAHFSALGQQGLDLFIDVVYVLCYGLIARAVVYQRQLLAD